MCYGPDVCVCISVREIYYVVMVFGLTELDEEDNEHDAENEGFIEEMMEQLSIRPDQVVQIERVGERRENHTRPMKVRMERKEFAVDVIAKSRKLKDTERYATVFLAPDRTREERSQHKKLVEEMKKKRVDFPDCVFFIRGNELCKKPRVS